VGCNAEVSVRIGNTSGTFVLPKASYPVGTSVADLAVADFNSDGMADLGLTGADGNLHYLYGAGAGTTGDGRFTQGLTATVGGHLLAMTANNFVIGGSGPAAIVAKDIGQIVSITGECSGATGRYVDLGYPIGGEALPLGTECSIQWGTGPYVNAVNVEISRDGGSKWERLASNLIASPYRWTPTPPGTLHGRIRVVDASDYRETSESTGNFSILPLVGVEPRGAKFVAFSLAYPNPARGAVRFDLQLPEGGPAAVEVFDLAGRRVQTLARGVQAPGIHRLVWDGTAAGGGVTPNGIYFVRARSNGFEAVRRVVRIR